MAFKLSERIKGIESKVFRALHPDYLHPEYHDRYANRYIANRYIATDVYSKIRRQVLYNLRDIAWTVRNNYYVSRNK